jgi:uncharacterized membrane protein YphA (DoxX/SURF4 family)
MPTMGNSRTKTAAYWVVTGVVAAACLLGGAVDVAHPPDAVAFLARLGYPAYFAVLIGVWKVLGGAVLLTPRFRLVKEWAYAGIFFDLSGAAVSHAASGDAPHAVFPIVLALATVASWILRPESRRLTSPQIAAAEG